MSHELYVAASLSVPLLLRVAADHVVAAIDLRTQGGIGHLPFAVLRSVPEAVGLALVAYLLRNDSALFAAVFVLSVALAIAIVQRYRTSDRWLRWWHAGRLIGQGRRTAIEHPESRRPAIALSVLVALALIVYGYLTGGVTPWLLLLAATGAAGIGLEIWMRRPVSPDEHT